MMIAYDETQLREALLRFPVTFGGATDLLTMVEEVHREFDQRTRALEQRAHAGKEAHESHATEPHAAAAHAFMSEITKKPDGTVWLTILTLEGDTVLCMHLRPVDCRALGEGLLHVMEGPADHE